MLRVRLTMAMRFAALLIVAAACQLLPARAATAADAAKSAGAKGQPATAQASDDDDDDDEGEAKPGATAYVDLSTYYFAGSGVSFGLGFGGPLISARTLTGGSNQSVLVDAPLTLEFNERFSVFVALSGSSFQSGTGPWSSFRPESWRTGFSADVIQQQDWLPTVTLSGFVARPADSSNLTFTATTLQGAVDLDRSLNADETMGIVAGGSFAHVSVDGSLARVRPLWMVYGGAYRQFGEWKIGARAGLQHFAGASIGSLVNFGTTNRPFVQLGLERLDDDDNRLFGFAVAVGWSPKPSVQLTLSTPIRFGDN